MHPCKTLPIAIFSLILGGISLIPSSELHAGASNKNGSPFGNGTFFPDSGTFSAIERSSNGFLGVLQFSTSSTNSSTNSLTNSGIATIYAQGEQFSGAAFGVVNGSTIAATYLGYYPFDVLVPTANYTTNGTLETVTYDNRSLSNTCSGQFTATLQNSYPTQFFTGNGTTSVVLKELLVDPATFLLSVTNTTIIYSASVSGSRLTQ